MAEPPEVVAAVLAWIYGSLAPLLQDEAVPYVVVSHSMGTWMAYEFLKLVAEKGIPYPKQLVVSGFPAPSWPEADRPWNKNAPMADPAFMDECRGWNVNEIVFQEGNWKVRAQQGRAREGGPGREGRCSARRHHQQHRQQQRQWQRQWHWQRQ